ncbi:cytochrome C [Rufibacter radiotolerans]|uniref:Cytochrome C n=1 Tax=Rufibacter radiotolerans TaxID=1379910 RepID=A0A0H4VP69_9BACT|nr:c-type cytochrome [Rufibacter radiotolerans]AKQ45524.1 cytochrome C [Rufibacter radiotolerans]
MKLNEEQNFINFLVKIANVVGLSSVVVMLLVGIALIMVIYHVDFTLPQLSQTEPPAATAPLPSPSTAPPSPVVTAPADDMWKAPDLASLVGTPEEKQITYGQELIAHTAQYLGPKGKVLQISNGMNCQNCHLNAGTKTFGNNYALVASTYPKFRGRSGTVESVEKRVNDCFERSLNGKPLKEDSKEMKAMVAYINWVGKEVKKDEKVKGAGLVELPLLDRAASPANGKAVYLQKCQSCHGPEGQGIKSEGSAEYQYPPLWGKSSYNNGAGLFRVSTFARYVKANMPLGATYSRPMLSDEEAWDLAAYVNTMPRPKKDLSKDWPDISKKPIDHPFGPYSDGFKEKQHKYGPFKPIAEAKTSMK